MKSSNGEIPSGLTLYTFDQPEPTFPDVDGVPITEVFLAGDKEARAFAKESGATKATNAITGEVVFAA